LSSFNLWCCRYATAWSSIDSATAHCLVLSQLMSGSSSHVALRFSSNTLHSSSHESLRMCYTASPCPLGKCGDPEACTCVQAPGAGLARLCAAKSNMISATASVALAAALLVGQAHAVCTYGKLPSQVVLANDALRIPIAGADPDAECAATAAAFGYTVASTSAQLHLVGRSYYCVSVWGTCRCWPHGSSRLPSSEGAARQRRVM
jgi:hypothetical protein